MGCVGLVAAFNDYLGNEPHGSKVVLELMAPLLNLRYRVTMDNWFSSPDLYSKQTDAMGSSRQSRASHIVIRKAKFKQEKMCQNSRERQEIYLSYEYHS
jgi:hypothetical protein